MESFRQLHRDRLDLRQVIAREVEADPPLEQLRDLLAYRLNYLGLATNLPQFIDNYLGIFPINRLKEDTTSIMP